MVYMDRSPDLTSPDFFLCGFLKNIVYAKVPTTRENMIERITIACRIFREMFFYLPLTVFKMHQVQLATTMDVMDINII